MNNNETKGLLAWVHVNQDHRNSSNGGISSRVSRVTIVADGHQPLPEDCRIFSPGDGAPAVRIVRRQLRGKEYVHLEPIAPVPSDLIGYMYGGAIVDSSDSRFSRLIGHDYPVHLHDRMETQKLYNALSQ